MIERHRVRTQGAEAVEETWQTVVPSAQLRRTEGQRYSFAWSSASVSGLSVVAYELHAPVRSSVSPESQVMVCRLSAADGGAWDEHGALDGDLPWATDGRPVSARWDGRARVHAMVFERELLERTAQAISGTERGGRLRWETRPVSVAAARHWERTYRYIAEATLAGDDAIPTTVAVELSRLAAHAMLSTYSPTFLDDVAHASQRRAAPATVRRALSFIDAHAHEPVTLDDIARAAGISTRGLQYAFRRALDRTPLQALRRARLLGARDDVRADASASIAEIARRWGFAHPSRFAAYYRDEFGETPAATRRRSE